MRQQYGWDATGKRSDGGWSDALANIDWYVYQSGAFLNNGKAGQLHLIHFGAIDKNTFDVLKKFAQQPGQSVLAIDGDPTTDSWTARIVEGSSIGRCFQLPKDVANRFWRQISNIGLVDFGMFDSLPDARWNPNAEINDPERWKHWVDADGTDHGFADWFGNNGLSDVDGIIQYDDLSLTLIECKRGFEPLASANFYTYHLAARNHDVLVMRGAPNAFQYRKLNEDSPYGFKVKDSETYDLATFDWSTC